MVLLRFDKEKDDWVVISSEDKQDGDIYLDGFLYKKLLFAREQIKKDHDVGGVVCGSEGSGKSSLGGTIMQFMTKNKFNPVDQIIKDEDDAFRILSNAKRGSAVMFDEGYLLFMSIETMKKSQRDLVKIFSIIRQKNLFFLIVAPSFFRMSNYFTLDRTRFMIRTYVKNNERGRFAYYGDKAKAKLYRLGKKEHDYNAVKPMFRGRFTQCDLLENVEYKKVKEETLMSAFRGAELKKPKTEREIWLEKRDEIIKSNMHIDVDTLSGILGVGVKRIYQIRGKIQDNKVIS